MNSVVQAQTPSTLSDTELFDIHYMHTSALGQLRNAKYGDAIIPERGFFNHTNIEKYRTLPNLAALISYLLGEDEPFPIPAGGLRVGNALRLALDMLRNSPECVRKDILPGASFTACANEIALRYTTMTIEEILDNDHTDIKINMKLTVHNDKIKDIALNYTQYSDDIPNILSLINIFNLFADILDLNYWDMNKPVLDNLTAVNVSPHRLIYHVCDLLGVGADRQRIVGRLDNDIINTIFKRTLGLHWHEMWYDCAITNDGNMFTIVGFVLTALKGDNEDEDKRKSTLDHISNGRNGLMKVFSLTHWEYILKHLVWFNDMHRHQVGKDVTTHHGHTLMENFLKKEDLSAMDLTKSPAVLFADEIKAAHDSVISKYSLLPFPQIPTELLKKVEELGFEHIDIPSRLAAEGSYMKHCAGGESYINSTHRGLSWFFHLNEGPTTPITRNSYVERGVTVELRHDENSFTNNQSKAFQNNNPDAKQDKIIQDLVNVMNEYGKTDGNKDWATSAILANEELTKQLRANATHYQVEETDNLFNCGW